MHTAYFLAEYAVSLGFRTKLTIVFNRLEPFSAAMIVCLCKAVSSSTVRRVIDEGAMTSDDVGRACGAGTDCGGCRGAIDDLLDEACDRACGRRLPLFSGAAAAE